MLSTMWQRHASSKDEAELSNVVVDTNVFISLLTDRNDAQRALAKQLLLRAEAGEITIVLPQFILFEIAHVLRNLYGVAPATAASLIRDTIALPGVILVTEYPWQEILDQWSDRLPSIADAGIAALGMTHRYDAVATFDKKLTREMTSHGVPAYWAGS
jgi:predicted nucleic acid-binding protein